MIRSLYSKPINSDSIIWSLLAFRFTLVSGRIGDGVAVGVSDEGVSWPDAESRAHLVLLLGVPAAKIRDYLLLMQKILRWHKETKTLDASGRVLDVAALIEELKAVVA